MTPKQAFLVSALVVAFACDDRRGNQSQVSPAGAPSSLDSKEAEFAAQITSIGQAVPTLDVLEELFAHKPFRDVYDHASEHAATATAMMAHPEVSIHEKLIVGYAMLGLPLEQFLALLSATADAVERGSTDVAVLESIAFAPLNMGKQWLIRHHEDPRVRAFLTRLSSMRQLPTERRAFILDKVLTGEAMRDYLNYMDMAGLDAPAD